MARSVTPEVLSGFLAEVRGYLPKIRGSVAAFADQPDRPQELEEAHRLIHSIKGTASMINLVELSQVASQAEEVLAELLVGDRNLDAATEDLLIAAISGIDAQVTPAATAPADAMDPELAATVAEEFHGYLEIISDLLRALEKEPDQPQILSQLRRPLHTIKGTAGIVGLVEVSRLGHRMEDLLADLDDREPSISAEHLQLLFQSTDLLVDLIDSGSVTAELASRLAANEQQISALLDSATGAGRELLAAPAAPTSQSTPTVPDDSVVIAMASEPGDSVLAAEAPVSAETPAAAESLLRIRADRLDGLLQMLGDVTLQRAGFDRQVVRMNELRGELGLNLRRLGRMARQLTTELDASGLAASASLRPVAEQSMETDFDSLEMDRYTQLNLLARQLEEAAADSAAVGSGFESLAREVEGFQTRLGVLTRDVQEGLTQLRTMSFGTLSNRLHRTVRVTAAERQKSVSLEIMGAAVELDKNVLEEITEPLLHLLRNAVDHGIEAPAQRRAAGKSEQGRIEIRAAFQGTEAVIQVRDDGAGLDYASLRQQAAELGVLPEESQEVTTGDLQSLIFQRGLSTAKAVSEVSGRGIGLDVVSASIARLRGIVEVDSEPGAGTTFSLRLPGGQSVLRVLVVVSGGESLAIPLAAIDRVESVTAADVSKEDGERRVLVRAESLRAYELHDRVGTPPRQEDSALRFPAIVLHTADQRFAVLVERILGVQEVVARPVAELFSRRLFGISSAALTGEGRVVLVINPNDLLRTSSARSKLPMVNRQRRRPVVLIVDDSLSVRQILGRFMERNGWLPLVARDGEDAIEVLKKAPVVPAVALVDLEMPRMDGYELTRTLQARAEYRQMPIVILTTRAGDKHRRKAFELGAREYVIKPFQEKPLLATIRQVLTTTGEVSGSVSESEVVK